MVFSSIRLFPSHRQRAELVAVLRSVQNLARSSHGCVSCWLSEPDSSTDQVDYLEQWKTEEALHDHIRSSLYRRVLAAMELSGKPPEVWFYFAEEPKGFELVETIRGAMGSTPEKTG